MQPDETKIPQTGEEREALADEPEAAVQTESRRSHAGLPDSSVLPGRTEPAEEELVLRLPETARIPEGASFYDGPDDTRCRVIRPGAKGRCTGTRMRAYGICAGHAGRGIAVDPASYSRQGHVERQRQASARATLGISARRASQPLQAARVRAQLRADDYARAVVDAPLDDGDLGTIPRQQAAIRALELLYPQVTATLDVSLPEQADEVSGMGWQEMQAMAAQLLGDQQ